jgi:hypothetical protein
MTTQFVSPAEAGARAEASLPFALTNPSLAPALAGARARGMADALELIGIAAALIDECGFALHVNIHARRLLGEPICEGGRLRALAPELDAALGAALEAALTTGAPARARVAAQSVGESGAVRAVRALPIAVASDDRFQLVRLVVVLEPHGAPDAEAFN